jgi:hypothetical protein
MADVTEPDHQKENLIIHIRCTGNPTIGAPKNELYGK